MPELPRLPRLHRHDLRLDQRRDRARHPEPGPEAGRRATTSPSTAARSSTAGTATRRSPSRWGSRPPRTPRCSTSPSGRCGPGWPAALAGGRLTDISAAVEESITAEPHRVRDRRPLRRSRHRHRDAPGPARAQLRPPRPRAASWCPGWRWRSSRWSPSATRRPWSSTDGWTVVTKDGSRAAHFEHTVAITPEGPGCSRPRTAASPAWRRSGSRPAPERQPFGPSQAGPRRMTRIPAPIR